MGRITSGIGLVSGINTADIIEQLMSLEARPKQLIQKRIDQANAQKLAYTDLSARLTSLRLSVTALKKATTFTQAKAASSDADAITATASPGAAKGTFQFQVARLVSAQQAVSNAGFTDTRQKVGAGTLTIELGGGELTQQTTLAQLNGGRGVSRGAFRITDGSGRSGVVDLGSALTLDDAVRKINTNLDVAVRARIDGDRLVLTDLSGGTLQQLTVTDLGDGRAAADLGIAGTAVAGELVGADISYVGRQTLLADLNDGRGVRVAKAAAADFQVTNSAGATFDVSLAGLTTVGQVIDAINSATGGTVTASLAPGANGLTLTDAGGGSLSVGAVNNSQAAYDLGILGTGTGTIAGRDVLASPNSVLLSSLRGGQGLDRGTVRFTSRAGDSVDVDLSGARTVSDVLALINDAAGAIGIRAELKASLNGIQITDTSGGAGDLVISDVGGMTQTAAQLGIAGTFSTAVASVQGANLQRRWVNENTPLSAYNGGRGVALGSIKVTSTTGEAVTIDLAAAKPATLGDVIDLINSKVAGVTAAVNANGDGLVLTDAAGGAGRLKVEDLAGSTSARDLGLAGEAAEENPAVIDGSFERTITVTDDDTFDDVLSKINAPGFAISAIAINDGSAAAPYRLSLSARTAGRAGRFVFDAGTTSLGTRNLVESQDAALIYGGGDAASGGASDQPLVITSPSNTVKDVVKGLTLELHAVSSTRVSVSVTEDVEGAVGELKKFVDTFNELSDKIRELTAFDSTSNRKGTLLGQAAVQRVEAEMHAMVQAVVNGAGRYRTLAEVGVTVGSSAKLEFDEEKFKAAFAADEQAVQRLFTLLIPADEEKKTPEKKGLAGIMEDRINKLIDPVNGLLTRTNQNLDRKTESFQDRIESLDKLLEAKRARLERQFANMEKVLAGLQSQQQSLAGLTLIQPMTAPRSSAA